MGTVVTVLSTLFINPSIVRFVPLDESIKLCDIRVDEECRKNSISLLLCLVPSGTHWSRWRSVYRMHDVVCVSVCTFKMVLGSCFLRVGVRKDEPAVRALNVSQIESAAAAVGPLPPLSRSLHYLWKLRSSAGCLRGKKAAAQQLKCVTLLVPDSPSAVFQPGLSCSRPLCAAHSIISLRYRFPRPPSPPTHRLRAEGWKHKILSYVGCPTEWNFQPFISNDI